MHARLYLYVTFGHQGIQAALHICNIRPLKVKKLVCQWVNDDAQSKSHQRRKSFSCSVGTQTFSHFRCPLSFVLCHCSFYRLVLEYSMRYLEKRIMFILQVASQLDNLQNLLGVVLKVLLHALGRNQSTCVLQNMFATQRSLVFKVGF